MTIAEQKPAADAKEPVEQLRQRLAARKVASLGVPMPTMSDDLIKAADIPFVRMMAEPVAPPSPPQQVRLATASPKTLITPENDEKGPQVQVAVRVEPERRARWQGYASQQTVALKNTGSSDRVTVQDIILEAMDDWERKHRAAASKATREATAE